jgi:hypothetical protein
VSTLVEADERASYRWLLAGKTEPVGFSEPEELEDVQTFAVGGLRLPPRGGRGDLGLFTGSAECRTFRKGWAAGDGAALSRA